MDRFQPEFGDYPQMFAGLLRQAVAEPELQFVVIDCQAGSYPSVSACDAYLITGSRNSVYDDEPWIAGLAAFVDRVLQSGGKVMGVCFGHQLLAHFFGGHTAQAGWVVGVQRCEVVSKADWMRPEISAFRLLSSHKDQVLELPPGARLLASSDVCRNSAYAMGDQVFTLQGHPEFSKPYARALMDLRRELLGAGTFKNGVGSLTEETDEEDVAQWILNFLDR
jgi:GMP synthase-like glutamine amidotransferase